MKRIFDISLAALILLLALIPMILLSILIKITSPGPIIHWSKRVGQNNREFLMPKFRTMKVNTPQLATHLMKDPETYLSSIGRFLRKFSLDELPQIISVLNGDMTFVGPRPALFNQDDLVQLRNEMGIEKLKPGITGWAQINGRDEIDINRKIELETEYLAKKGFLLDIYIIFITFIKVFRKKGVSH